MDGSIDRLGLKPAFEAVAYPYNDVLDRFSEGRSVSDGYRRGTGLEFGDLRASVDAHPLFQEAMGAAVGRSVMATDRLRNLFLIILNHLGDLPSQSIVEFGSYKGGSLLFFATLLRRLYPRATVTGFDTFAGMPETDKSVDLHNAGDFADTTAESILTEADRLGLDNIRLVKGMVETTFPEPAPTAPYGLAHIDLDLYRPIRHVQSQLWPLMCVGGYVVYDDATVSSCLGATLAVEELIAEQGRRSEQIFPHFVFRA